MSNPVLMAVYDTLAGLKTRPRRVERALRRALREAIAWRIGGGAAPRAEAFIAAARAASRCDVHGESTDRAERTRTLLAVTGAARRLCASRLQRRLMSVPAAQFVPIATGFDGPDAVVRDRSGRLHAIILMLRCDPLEARRTATLTAQALRVSPADRLAPLTVHVQSLDGRRFIFSQRVGDDLPARVA